MRDYVHRPSISYRLVPSRCGYMIGIVFREGLETLTLHWCELAPVVPRGFPLSTIPESHANDDLTGSFLEVVPLIRVVVGRRDRV
jgi:hypothetical protein